MRTMEELAAKVLAKQKHGLEIHFRLMQIYHLMGYKIMCRLHRHQYTEESSNHAFTALKLACDCGALIEPAAEEAGKATAKSEIGYHPQDTTEDEDEYEPDFSELWTMTGLHKTAREKEHIHRLALQMWRAWEKEAADVYCKMFECCPDDKFWAKLISAAMIEYRTANRLLNESRGN